MTGIVSALLLLSASDVCVCPLTGRGGGPETVSRSPEPAASSQQSAASSPSSQQSASPAAPAASNPGGLLVRLHCDPHQQRSVVSVVSVPPPGCTGRCQHRPPLPSRQGLVPPPHTLLPRTHGCGSVLYHHYPRSGGAESVLNPETESVGVGSLATV